MATAKRSPFEEGTVAFESGNLPVALEHLTEAVEVSESDPLCRIKRAAVYTAMKEYEKALSDAEAALALDSGSSDAFMQKGIALFHLEEYESAKGVFEQGIEAAGDASLSSFKMWKRKCDAELDMKRQEEDGVGSTDTPVVGVASAGGNAINQAEAVPVSVAPKIRYDWYQTDQHVIISIMIKSVGKDDLHVHFTEKTVSVTIKLPRGSDYSLELDLQHPIQSNRASAKVLSTKVELKMPKVEAERWSALEGAPEIKAKQISQASASSAQPSYPSSHTGSAAKDWDKLVAEIKEEEKDEKLDGDAALNKFFRDIYSGATDETKRAMNKSFAESSGTVLSTNWKDVGKEEVKMKPPDGMEWKNYST